MKKILLLLILSLTACSLFSDKKKQDEKAEAQAAQLLLLAAIQNQCNPATGGFSFPDFFGSEYTCLRTTQVHSGSTVNIYVQNGLESLQASYGLAKPDYRTLASVFESTIQKNLEPALGKPSDINQDGKIDIVFFAIESMISSGAFIAGFVDPIHFFVNDGLPSNQREILFINGLELLSLRESMLKEKKPDPLYSTIAHEYQHLLRLPYQMSMTNRNSPIPIPKTSAELASRLNFDDTWIDEGTSEVASDIAGFGPQYLRVSCFRGDPRYGCSGGFNGRSLVDWNGTILNYSMSYAFMKYLYEVSGSTKESRDQFFNTTITGSTSSRGKNAKTLAQVFVSSAPSYNASVLTSNSVEAFQRLYASFLARSMGYETNGTLAEDSLIRIGNNTEIGMHSILTSYPYPSDLYDLMTMPSSVIKLSGSNFEFMPFRAYRIGGTRAAGSYNENVVAVKRGKNGGTDPLEFLILNGSLEKDIFITTKSEEMSFITLSEKPNLQLPISQLPIETCSGEHLRTLSKYRLFQYLKN